MVVFSLLSFKGLELLGVCLVWGFFLVSSKGLDIILFFLIVYSVQYHLKCHNGKSLRTDGSGFLGMQSNAALGSTKALMSFFWDKARYSTKRLCPLQHWVKQLVHTTRYNQKVVALCHLEVSPLHRSKTHLKVSQNFIG